jgi:hypothetical protein
MIKMQFTIIWPERRVVSEEQIKTWYLDAVDNGDVNNLGVTDPKSMAMELHSAGLITLGHN